MFKDSYRYSLSMNSNQEIISRLKFISKLKKGEKINTRHMYVQPDGLGTCLSRTFFYQDNRGNALNFCQETITRAFELLVTLERSDNNADKVLFFDLLIDLQQSTTGLNNLKFTYISDIKFCCDMDTLLQVITARLDIYQKRMNDRDNKLSFSKSKSDLHLNEKNKHIKND
jgi:hypothetical protein